MNVLLIVDAAGRELATGAVGFQGISTAWWRFDVGERARVCAGFARVVQRNDGP